jgi:hypothetical protein
MVDTKESPEKSKRFVINNIEGIANHSKVPLRLATMTGFIVALMSLLVALEVFWI